MSTVDNGQGPAPVHASGSATVGIGSQQTSGSGSGSTTAMAMATATVECVKMPSWSKCQVLMADVYGSGVTGGPFAPPACFTKDTQRAKWEAEVAKLKPFVSTLERVLAMEGGKLKDTEAKNAAKAFSKANSKLDKKLGFEAAAATNEPFLVWRRIGDRRRTPLLLLGGLPLGLKLTGLRIKLSFLHSLQKRQFGILVDILHLFFITTTTLLLLFLLLWVLFARLIS